MGSLFRNVATAVVVVVASGCTVRNTRTAATPPAPIVKASTTEPNLIPAGTTFAVRTNETIEARRPGQTYSAQVAQAIQNATGATIVPQGSPAELVVVQTSWGGTFGTPSMALAIRSITVSGRKYSVTSASQQVHGDEGLGANRRTAEMVGGGAVLGTLVGAVAGGGKGAAIGAVVGAAGGAAAQVLTRGKEVRVPAETLLTFRLDEPWLLTP